MSAFGYTENGSERPGLAQSGQVERGGKVERWRIALRLSALHSCLFGGEGVVDGLAGGLGAVGEAMADIGGAGADMALAEFLAGCVEACLRARCWRIAAGKAEGGGDYGQEKAGVVQHGSK
jgi:hypothetical protein